MLGDLWQGHPNYVKLPGTADIEDKLGGSDVPDRRVAGAMLRITAGSSTWLWSGKS